MARFIHSYTRTAHSKSVLIVHIKNSEMREQLVTWICSCVAAGCLCCMLTENIAKTKTKKQ